MMSIEFEAASQCVLSAVRAGQSNIEAAKFAGIRRETLQRWLRLGKQPDSAYAVFRTAFYAAQAAARTAKLAEWRRNVASRPWSAA
jgi:hypothetical protein